MIKLLKKGYAVLWEYKWMVILLYTVQAFYGLLIGSKVKSALTSALGNSASRKEIENGYDSDIFTDLFTHEGLSFEAATNVAFIGLPIFLLLGILIKGGIIVSITNNENGLIKALKNGVKYFIHNLGISLLVLFFLTIILAAIWVPYMSYTVDLNRMPESIFDTFETEKPFIIGLMFLFSISVLLSILAAAWRTRSLSLIAKKESDYFRKGLYYAVKNAYRVIPFSIALLALGLISIYFFKFLITFCSNSSWLYVACSIAIGQILIIGLCKLRLMFLGAIVKDN